MNLADKANLYFKIGSFVNIPFDHEEEIIVKTIEQCETFDDVLDAQKLHQRCLEQLKQGY